jgi:ABC-2 type transport system permease protein
VTALPARPAWSPFARYRRILWILTTRDLKVRYSTSALGYLWSILDPLLMALIYWFIFTVLIQRSVGESPYIVFLLCGLLPWMWFNGAVSDCTRAFLRDAKLVRSTKIPRTIWVNRLVLSKGLEFLFSIPVLAFFAIVSGATLHWQAVYWLLAIAIQLVLTIGIGLIVAPLVVFLRDMDRAVKLTLRLMFYASPIIYSLQDLGERSPVFEVVGSFNPLAGIIGLYRSAFFPDQLSWIAVGISAAISVILFVIGFFVFRRCIAAVLKEI